MAKTLAEQLSTVQSAIEKIESGAQQVTVDGVTITRASLSVLYAREQHLLDKINTSSNGPSRTVCEF